MLIGPAGTGKTTLLKVLCSVPGLAEKGLLLLAPTGKARVRLEEQTGRRGAGQTLAQFLIRQQRYDGQTSAYFPKPDAPRCGDYRTVIVDECSMLTEEQLAALIDSLRNVERLVLVGDPRQLPPIGAGRPFVDIVRELEPENVGIARSSLRTGVCRAHHPTAPARRGPGRRAPCIALQRTGARSWRRRRAGREGGRPGRTPTARAVGPPAGASGEARRGVGRRARSRRTGRRTGLRGVAGRCALWQLPVGVLLARAR